MSDNITVSGVIGSDPRHLTTSEGLAITTFRVASSQRRFDTTTKAWVDASTNWFDVAAFRQLATNAAASLRKGDHVVVSGRLRIKPWQNGEKHGLSVEIEAEAMGHDLFWGRSSFIKTPQSLPPVEQDPLPPGIEAIPESPEPSAAGGDGFLPAASSQAGFGSAP